MVPKWATSHPQGSPLCHTVALAPQIDAGLVAPRIIGGIFGTGSQPHVGRLSTLSLLLYKMGVVSMFSMGLLPEVCVCIYQGA